jgi:lipid-A-disaccharide synthase-like uncharacterized protein
MDVLEVVDQTLAHTRQVAQADGLEEQSIGLALSFASLVAWSAGGIPGAQRSLALVVIELAIFICVSASVARWFIRQIRADRWGQRGWRLIPHTLGWEERRQTAVSLLCGGLAVQWLMSSPRGEQFVPTIVWVGLVLGAGLAYISIPSGRSDLLYIAAASALTGLALDTTQLMLFDKIAALLMLIGSVVLAHGVWRQYQFRSHHLIARGGQDE